jgi:hypothetical protein
VIHVINPLFLGDSARWLCVIDFTILQGSDRLYGRVTVIVNIMIITAASVLSSFVGRAVSLSVLVLVLLPLILILTLVFIVGRVLTSLGWDGRATSHNALRRRVLTLLSKPFRPTRPVLETVFVCPALIRVASSFGSEGLLFGPDEE